MKTVASSSRFYSRAKHVRLVALLILLTSVGCLKPAAKSEPQRPFSMIVLPDTQLYSQKRPDLFFAQTNWIKANREKENIVFVMHVGDIVQNHNKRPREWKDADEAMAVLDGVVPYGVAIGNHDYDDKQDLQKGDAKATMFLQHFDPEKRFKNQPGYGGASPNQLNSYHLLTAEGIKFLILFLEMSPPDEALEWARGVLARHQDRQVIVALHSHLYGVDGIIRDNRSKFRGNSNTGEMVWEKFIRSQPRIFMVVCGHVGQTEELHQVVRNDAGAQVLEMLVDYQRRVNGGDSWLRIIRFVPAKREIQMRTYSPALDQYETDANSEFTISWELN